MGVRNILILLAILVVIGGIYVVVSRPDEESSSEPTIYVWNINADELEHIEISLPRLGKSQAFVKVSQDDDKFPWYFDDSQQSPVDSERWGGGIPLLLSGPGADRVITENATDDQLAEYGLTQPSMQITLTMTNGNNLKIDVGDSTPNGNNFYVRLSGTRVVVTIDYTWYYVLERLVTDPPYASAGE